MSSGDTLPCVVFDIDDTLYLERDYVRSGFLAVGRYLDERHGVSGVGQRAWELFVGGHRNTTFDLVCAEFGLPASIVPDLVRHYRHHIPAITPLGDATAAVQRLLRVARLAVITDGPVESQGAKAVALGVHDWSEATILTAELGEGLSKPSPEPYHEVERRIPGAASYAYVADNPHKDFIAPRQLGWRTVRVRRTGSLHLDAPSGDDVDVEVDGLDGVEAALWPESHDRAPQRISPEELTKEGQQR